MGIVILDKELKAEIDESRRLEDIGNLFKDFKHAMRASDALIREENETRKEFYSKFELFDPREDYTESLIKGGKRKW